MSGLKVTQIDHVSVLVTDVARSRNWISFSGAAGQIESAFQTALHQYVENGETHFANASEPAIPERFSSVVRAVRAMVNSARNTDHPVARCIVLCLLQMLERAVSFFNIYAFTHVAIYVSIASNTAERTVQICQRPMRSESVVCASSF